MSSFHRYVFILYVPLGSNKIRVVLNGYPDAVFLEMYIILSRRLVVISTAHALMQQKTSFSDGAHSVPLGRRPSTNHPS